MDINSALLSISGLLDDGSGGGSSILVNKNINQNGVYLPIDDNADGYKKVSVNVPPPTLVTKTITENGTYAAEDDNADGYSSVTVDVAGSRYTLLGSGTYTKTNSTAYMTIPIDIAGTPACALVVCPPENYLDATGQTIREVIVNCLDDELYAAIGARFSVGYIRNSSNTIPGYAGVGINNVSLTTSEIHMYQVNNASNWRANTYNWYVWGLEASE